MKPKERLTLNLLNKFGPKPVKAKPIVTLRSNRLNVDKLDELPYLDEFDLIYSDPTNKKCKLVFDSNWVYVFYNSLNDSYKIGISEDINRRLHDIRQVSGCLNMMCVAWIAPRAFQNMYSVETFVHKVLKPWRIGRTEWFTCTRLHLRKVKKYLHDCGFEIYGIDELDDGRVPMDDISWVLNSFPDATEINSKQINVRLTNEIKKRKVSTRNGSSHKNQSNNNPRTGR